MPHKINVLTLGSRDGAVGRALTYHQFGLGSIPLATKLFVICGSSLLSVLVLALRGFSLGTPVFPSPKNQH